MKKPMTLLIFLFFSPPMYADQWDDEYNSDLDFIQEGLSISDREGYKRAVASFKFCSNYVIGFIDGSNEHKSKRYTDWMQEMETLLDKLEHFIHIGDHGNASYYAKKIFELSCQYAYGLQRENTK